MHRSNVDAYQPHADGTDLACENLTGKRFLEIRQMIGTKSNKIAAVVTFSVLVTMLTSAHLEAGIIGQTKYTCDDDTCEYYPEVFTSAAGRNFDQHPFFDELVIDWSTEEMSGTITAEHLTDLTFTLSNAGEVVYQDQAIINSLPQLLDGGPRDMSQIIIDIDLDVPFLSRYYSVSLRDGEVFPGNHPDIGTGLQFVWSASGGSTKHLIYHWGGWGLPILPALQTGWRPSSATTVTTIVPEPATSYLFGLAMLAGGSLRRRRR